MNRALVSLWPREACPRRRRGDYAGRRGIGVNSPNGPFFTAFGLARLSFPVLRVRPSVKSSRDRR